MEVKNPDQMTMDEAHEALMAMFADPVEQPPMEAKPEEQHAYYMEAPAVNTEVQPDGVVDAPVEPAPQNPESQPTEEPQTAPTGAGDEMAERMARFEAELQRLRSENGRMRKVATENAMLRRKLKSQEPPHEPERKRLAEFTEEQEIQLGDDVVGALKSKLADADEMLQAMDERYRQQEEYLSEIRGRELKAAREMMLDAVERQYGEDIWDAMKSDAYAEWADNYDPLTGQQNRDLLQRIDANADSEAAIALIGNFVRQSGVKLKAAAPATNARSTSGTPVSANMAQRPVGQSNAAPYTQPQQKEVVWTVKAAEAAYARADRDPMWAKSAEGKAIFESIMNATLSGRLQR